MTHAIWDYYNEFKMQVAIALAQREPFDLRGRLNEDTVRYIQAVLTEAAWAATSQSDSSQSAAAQVAPARPLAEDAALLLNEFGKLSAIRAMLAIDLPARSPVRGTPWFGALDGLLKAMESAIANLHHDYQVAHGGADSAASRVMDHALFQMEGWYQGLPALLTQLMPPAPPMRTLLERGRAVDQATVLAARELDALLHTVLSHEERSLDMALAISTPGQDDAQILGYGARVIEQAVEHFGAQVRNAHLYNLLGSLAGQRLDHGPILTYLLRSASLAGGFLGNNLPLGSAYAPEALGTQFGGGLYFAATLIHFEDTPIGNDIPKLWDLWMHTKFSTYFRYLPQTGARPGELASAPASPLSAELLRLARLEEGDGDETLAQHGGGVGDDRGAEPSLADYLGRDLHSLQTTLSTIQAMAPDAALVRLSSALGGSNIAALLRAREVGTGTAVLRDEALPGSLLAQIFQHQIARVTLALEHVRDAEHTMYEIDPALLASIRPALLAELLPSEVLKLPMPAGLRGMLRELLDEATFTQRLRDLHYPEASLEHSGVVSIPEWMFNPPLARDVAVSIPGGVSNPSSTQRDAVSIPSGVSNPSSTRDDGISIPEWIFNPPPADGDAVSIPGWMFAQPEAGRSSAAAGSVAIVGSPQQTPDLHSG